MELHDYLDLIMKKDMTELLNILPAEFASLFDAHQADLTRELDSVVLYQETTQVLEALSKEYRLILMSNLASPYKQPVFHHNLNPYFEHLIFSSDIGFRKPETEIFKTVETLTGHQPHEILMIGDSLKSDIGGARKMGWHYLRVARTGTITTDFEIEGLTEISKRLT